MPHDGALDHPHVGYFLQWNRFLNTDKDALFNFKCLGGQNALHAGEVSPREQLPQWYPEQQERNPDDADSERNGS